MKNFFKTHQNLIKAIAAALLSAALAIVLALAFIDDTKELFLKENQSSSISSSTSSAEVLSSEIVETPQPEEDDTIPLVITSPSKTDTTVSESNFVITGTSDPEKTLLLNGKEVSRLETGEFSFDVELTAGDNVFEFEYNDKTYTYTIRYNFTVIKAYAPYEKQSYEAGSTFVAVAYARVNSTSVTATFNGKTIALSPQPYKEGEEFTNFVGSFNLPAGNDSNINLGGVKFTASCNGFTNNYTSPSIVCLRDKALDGTQIVEIIASQAETFNGDTTDDWSRPTNSYLPKGTVDYKVGGIIHDAKSGNSYYKLRCGKRVYITKDNDPDTKKATVSKMYQGELPEYNDISLASNTTEDKHTCLTFDTAWKAPFAVTLAPQNYTNPAIQDYSISKATFTYVDIKFFYTKKIGGQISFSNHPLFSSAKILSGEDGYVLRLYLNEAGAFYGWNAEYNKNGQLVFKFLNPPKIKSKNNLSGIKIVIDAGHGGRDPGAEGVYGDKLEAERNLSLAFKLKAELERYGATVIMSRTTDVAMTADERCEFLRKQAPDLCISIHHDANDSARANGVSIFSSTPFSNDIMNFVYDRTKQEGLYRNYKKGWHYFYLARVTSCPVVLTENGFMSNLQDCKDIANETINTQKAKAIAAGVLDYFNRFIWQEPENNTPIEPNAPITPIEPIDPIEPDPIVPEDPII